ncbi:MAG: hypothetical protein HY390_00280 [Deltaproteobacteria bacterium]|nr:hypothetical protein [Deltaproteobacteria bacterium]
MVKQALIVLTLMVYFPALGREVICVPAKFYEAEQITKDALKSIVYDVHKKKWYVALRCGKNRTKMVSLEFDRFNKAQSFYGNLQKKKVYAHFNKKGLSRVFIKNEAPD